MAILKKSNKEVGDVPNIGLELVAVQLKRHEI